MDQAPGCARRLGLAAGLGGAGLGLRWATAETLHQASTTDLESMAALTIAAVAWTAYGWLVLAVFATLLAQLPGLLGRSATLVAAAITSEASRRLLRSTLGVAAAAPLTVGVAEATPVANGGSAVVHAIQQYEPPRPNWAPTHTEWMPAGPPRQADWAPIEQPSSVDLIGATHSKDWADVERPSNVDLTRRQPPRPAAEPTSVADPARSRAWAVGRAEPKRRASDRIAVPDRPTVGTPTRYAEIRPTGRPEQQPTDRSPVRVTVRRGDSLWKITAKELGPRAGNAAIARRWPQWYATNARVIGDDPDLLLPGQVLRAPKRTSPPIDQSRHGDKPDQEN